MKFLFFFVFALLAMFAGAQKQNENCDDIACPYNYDPVCAQADGLPLTFGNECSVRTEICRKKKREKNDFYS